MEGWRHVRSVVLNERWRESHFKFIHHAIYGFSIPPHPNCPNRLTACPKCDTPTTDLVHGVWTCPSVVTFWADLVRLITSKMNLSLDVNPQTLLFHDFPPEVRLPRVLHIILLAALRSLLAKCLEPSIPTMAEVLSRISHYLQMDRLETLRSKNIRSNAFFKKWKPYIVAFLREDDIRQLMLLFRTTTWYLTSELAGTLGKLQL